MIGWLFFACVMTGLMCSAPVWLHVNFRNIREILQSLGYSIFCVSVVTTFVWLVPDDR